MKLFKDLRFSFYPPKHLDRLNSIKATASARNGAIIQNQVDSSTTHIIVAQRKASPVFWRTVASKAGGNCAIVSDLWPSDCIEKGKLLDVRDYLIKEADQETPEPPRSPISDHTVHCDRKSPQLEVDVQTGSSPKKAKRENAIVAKNAVEEKSEPVVKPAEPSRGIPENQTLIEVFHDLVLSRRTAGEDFSERAYSRVLKSLESLRVPVVSGRQAAKVMKLSPKMVEIIDDALSGKLDLVSRAQRQRIEVCQRFATVYGIGPVHSRKLYDLGYRTLADIYPVVDKNAQVSIDHNEEFVERISRMEVAQHYRKVQELMAAIDPKVELYCMGSFRRGQPDCGDIDIILTKKDADAKEIHELYRALLRSMFETGFATYTFTEGSDRWLGATQVIGRWRRMDILLVPWSELGAALIYYTGDDLFNRELRLHAKRLGMRLNQNGLFKEKELVESHDEAKIFEILGRPFLPPESRITPH